MKNKIISLALAVVLTFACSATCFASSSNVDLSFNTGTSGNGFVNGDFNSVYHTLSAGTAYLKVNSTTATSESGKGIYVSLRLKKVGPDTVYGTKLVKSCKTYTLASSVKSSTKYYLYAYGNGGILIRHSLTGKLYN